MARRHSRPLGGSGTSARGARGGSLANLPFTWALLLYSSLPRPLPGHREPASPPSLAGRLSLAPSERRGTFSPAAPRLSFDMPDAPLNFLLLERPERVLHS